MILASVVGFPFGEGLLFLFRLASASLRFWSALVLRSIRSCSVKEGKGVCGFDDSAADCAACTEYTEVVLS